MVTEGKAQRGGIELIAGERSCLGGRREEGGGGDVMEDWGMRRRKLRPGLLYNSSLGRRNAYEFQIKSNQVSS